MEGYDGERLTITRAPEALSERFDLHYVRTSDVGEPTVQERKALFDDGGLLLDRAYDFAGARYAALSIEREGEALILVPYPDPGALFDAGGPRPVYRR